MALISGDAGDAAGQHRLASNVPYACTAIQAAARSLHDHIGNPHRNRRCDFVQLIDPPDEYDKRFPHVRPVGWLFHRISSVQKARKVGQGARQTGGWHWPLLKMDKQKNRIRMTSRFSSSTYAQRRKAYKAGVALRFQFSQASLSCMVCRISGQAVPARLEF